jgi:hypothetical protein
MKKFQFSRSIPHYWLHSHFYIVSTVNDKLQKEMTITLAEKENQFQQQVIIVVFYFIYYVYLNVTQNSSNG